MGDSLLIIRMSYIEPRPDYDPDHLFAGKTPVRKCSVSVYSFGSFDIYQFKGRGGVDVQTREVLETYTARRLFKNRIKVIYQYSTSHNDLEFMNSAVLN